jgi:nucleoside-diphosphate-sugar epimerase
MISSPFDPTQDDSTDNPGLRDSHPPRPGSVLIVGCGYLGRRIARQLIRQGRDVFGTTRSPAKAEQLRSLGIHPVVVDLTDSTTEVVLPRVAGAIYCVGYDRSSGMPQRAVVVDALIATLPRLHARADKLAVASTTGVLGGTHGEWVDETTTAPPLTESGRLHAEAEQAILEFGQRHVWPVSIVRLAGLYGPGRLIRRADLLAGRPLSGDPDKWLNLIHIDDAAAALIASLDHAPPGAIHLAADDRPLPRRDYYLTSARLLGAPEPQFESNPVNPDRPAEPNRRVRNRRLKQDLNWKPTHPTIDEGLIAALEEEQRNAHAETF